MKWLDKILGKFKRVKPKIEELITLPAPQSKGYFNGACPECDEHIGVWVWLEYSGRVRKRKHHRVYCPCCGKEIFKKVESHVEWGRI